MVSCVVIGCSHKQGKHPGVRFFGIPTVITRQCAKTLDLSQRRRAQWIARINRSDITDSTVRKHHKVCGQHFVQGHPSSLFDPNNQDWAPSQDLGYENMTENQSERITPDDAPLNLEEVYIKEEKPFFDSDHSDSMTSDAPEEIPVEPMIISVDVGDVSEEPSVKLESCPSVTESVAQTCHCMVNTSVIGSCNMDASTQTRLCCDEVRDLKLEREALIQHVGCLNAELSEKVEKLESFDKCLAETTLILSEKNLRIYELETKLKQLESVSMDSRGSIENHVELRRVILNIDNLKEDDKKVSFYTGLPSFTLLMRVFNLVVDKVKDSGKFKLTRFQQFLMLFMWLRLGLKEQDIGYRFGVSQSSVSRILYRWLIPLSSALETFILWPNREELQSSMPPSIQQNWKNAVVIIIDCFEIPVKRPSSVPTRGGTWSQSKQNNTVKFLIGITPQGKISFTSKAWDGGTSEKHITEQCGLLDKLLLGDIVMAYQGFNTANSVGIMGARLASIEGKLLLSFDDEELPKKVANVRIQVDSVIGLVCRKFQLLSSTVPTELLTKKPDDDLAPIDYVVRVCCALSNICRSVVPLE